MPPGYERRWVRRSRPPSRRPTCEDRDVRRANVISDGCEYDPTAPGGYRSGVARVGKAAGGEALAVKVYEMPAGQSVCPYHYEYEEEWLLVLDGCVLVRTPDGEPELGRGEIVCFPP